MLIFSVCQYCKESLSMDINEIKNHGQLCTLVDRPNKSYRFVCYKCPYHSQFLHRMLNHLKIHLKVKNFGCPYCPYRSSSKTVVKSHLIYKHSNVERMECQFCDYGTKLKSQLKYHVRHKHSDVINGEPFF